MRSSASSCSASASAEPVEVERLGIVGTGLIGASVGLAAKRAGVARVAGFDFSDEHAAGRARARRDRRGARRARPTLGDADLIVVAAPVTQLCHASRARPARRRRRGCTVTDVGSTKAAVCAARSATRASSAATRSAAPRRTAPRTRRADLFDGATWFLTPSRATEPAALPARARLRLGARRDARRDRPAGARPPRRAHEPPAARARQPARQPGRRDARRRPRAARGGRRLAARHDARRRREPAHLGRHLPRERRRDRASRSPSTAAGSSSSRRRSRRATRGFLARWIGEAADNRRRMLAGAFPDPGDLQQLRVHVPDRPGVLAGITQALGAAADQHRGLRAPPRLARARRHADGARHRRGRGASARPQLLEAQGYGVVVSPVLAE